MKQEIVHHVRRWTHHHETVKAPYILVQDHRQCVSTTPEMEREPETNDCDLNILDFTLAEEALNSLLKFTTYYRSYKGVRSILL